MIGGWPAPSRGGGVVLALALLGALYLILQARPGPLQLSNWRGMPLGQPGIVGEAAPLTGRGQPGDDVPRGNPLGVPNTIMTQGYGVGSHAPAAIWGGVDLAIDGDGDGQPEPGSTLGVPIYATHAGVASVKPDTWPGGNYLAIKSEHYKTAFAHLKEYAVADGQWVERGQMIGYVGSTGQSSGPHLHYEVWQDGVNVNPLDFGALESTR